MPKAKVNIYWKGIWYKAGSEVPEDVPARFTDAEVKVLVPKVEDKNGAPKRRSKKAK